MKNPKVVIIIANLNEKEFLKGCLNSIRKNLYKNYKIIVVDNASIDGSQNMIRHKYTWVDLVQNKVNRGFAGGNNDGIEYAIKKYSPNYFYLLNNDTIVEKEWLNETIKIAEKNQNIGIVGSKELTFERKPAICAGWMKMFGVKYYFGKENKEVDWVYGAGILIRKEVIKKIGLLDEIYNPAYYEEIDFEKRTLLAGFKIVHCPKSIFLHKGGATTSKFNKNFSQLFYKNRIIYFFRYYPKIYFIPRLINDLFYGIKNGKLMNVIRGYKMGIKTFKKII